MARHKYCWDSCVFIAILTGEQRAPSELEALRDVMDLFDRGEAVVVTSALLEAEVLDAVGDHGVRQRLEELLRRSNFVVQDVTRALRQRAAGIRQSLRARAIRLETPDATFIATALIHGCTALQTYDGGLLNLSGREEVDRLRITIPQAEQTSLRL